MLQYNITNLICGYGGKTVLEIEKLEIKKGKLYFIVGSSGIGKSTFLEMIGLMNNSNISSKSNVAFNTADSTTDLCSLWKNQKALSRFRLDNYAFIFQSTNLIPHYTVRENIAVPMLLNDIDIEEAERRMKPIMNRLNLMPSEFLNRPVERLSGGQQQRVAFIRAFISRYQVIFGDEPTGNLDIKTANDLMRELKTEVKANAKTAIIVSHDVELALNHADYILVFSNKATSEESKIGQLKQNNIFETTSQSRDILRERILSEYEVELR